MAKVLRWSGYAVGGLLVLVLLAAAAIWLISERAVGRSVEPKSLQLAEPTPAQLADAPRMLRVHGCISCHGEGLRGRLFFDEQNVATVYAPNVALLAATATDQQLDQAIRQGIGHDGRPLWIMPSAGYQYLSGAEAAALIRAIRALPGSGKPTPPIALGPLARLGIALGSFRAQPEVVEEYHQSPLPGYGPQFEAGRHLTQVNCADCHGPQLKGKEISPGTVSVDLDLVGAYDRDQFRRLLREGKAPSGKDIGLMARVAVNDFRHLRDDEIDSIHAYLVERAGRTP